MATITRNRVRDFYRRAARNPRGAGGTENLADWQNLPDPIEQSLSDESLHGELDGEISRRVLELVRSEFEERTWLAFKKTAIEEKVPSDVAEELGMSVASVYQAKSRILRRLRQQLADLPQ